MRPKAQRRIVELLIRILRNPYEHNRKDLARHFDISIDRIKEDVKVLANIGIRIHQDPKKFYSYGVLPDPEFKELSQLQFLTVEERATISRALYDKLGSQKKAESINNKLASLYNFQRLGLRALRTPALERIDDLTASKKAKKQVVLENYSSNSGETRHRYLEVYRIDAELDTIQAFDTELKENRHFRLSRIERVKVLDSKWQFEKEHRPKLTDVFRIANTDQIRVHLKLKNQAYNFLSENYHKALSEIHPASTPNTWDFETPVNADFYGLTNFIMAHYEHIEIVYPTELQQHIAQKAKALLDKLS